MRYKLLKIFLGVLLVVLFAAKLGQYWHQRQWHATTEDAYVKANIISSNLK
jgi:multidrug resistance efflux pump